MPLIRRIAKKKFSGSAGAMEVGAAKVLWGRSFQRNVRYTAMISTCIFIYKFVNLKCIYNIILKYYNIFLLYLSNF